MKLSFSLSSKPSSRTNPSRAPAAAAAAAAAAADDNGVGREFVTVFDPSQTLAADAPSKLVIPPIPNADYLLHPPKKAKYMPPLPSSAADADADADDPSAAAKFVLDTSGEGPASHIAYGLTVRSGSAADDRGDSQSKKSGAAADDSILRRYKEDMKILPEDRGFDEFQDVAVEGFGAALLAGYGWSEGKGIGRNNSKGDTKVVQYDRRAGTTGLGYNPSTADPKKKRGEWVFKNDNKVKDKGKDKDKDRESDKVRVSKVERREEKKREKGVSLGRKSSTSSSNREKKEGSVRWLTSHIKVRVISKEFMGGKLYLKKGRIVDVVGPTTCDISMDESRELVQGVDQDMLETAIPKRGGSVLVLYGEHKGVYGSLVERNIEDETGVVRDADSHDMFNVRLEQIAEYVGDPAYLGY